MYKSPIGKLVKFFLRSRDRWKVKCQASKREVKKLTNQVRAVEKSRDHWKEVAKESRRAASKYQRELEELKNRAMAECF